MNKKGNIMKIKQLTRRSVFAGMLAGILSGNFCAAADSGKSTAVQIDLGKLLNTRVVITQKDGQLQMADNSVDHETSSFLITKSAAEISKAGKINPLIDSGFFPANEKHPDVQLAYGTAGGGPQVHRSADRTETYSFPVPTNHYAQMQLFFISADGPTPVSIKLQYADGSSEQRVTLAPDFAFLPKATDKGWFLLAENFGKVNRQGLMTESVHHFIHGFDLDPDPTKVLQQIEITKENSKTVLNLFGTTGKLSD